MRVQRGLQCWCGMCMRCGCCECRACGWKCGSAIMSSAADVLWISVVREMRGVGGVCKLCVCVWLGAVCVWEGASR